MKMLTDVLGPAVSSGCRRRRSVEPGQHAPSDDASGLGIGYIGFLYHCFSLE